MNFLPLASFLSALTKVIMPVFHSIFSVTPSLTPSPLAIVVALTQAWQRVRVGCALARSAPEWTAIVGRYNSGTYNNQYMVIDLNR